MQIYGHVLGKIAETPTSRPEIMDLNIFVNNSYTSDDYRILEHEMSEFFDWHFSFPTPLEYIYYHIHMAITDDDIRLKNSTLRQILLELVEFIRKYVYRTIEGWLYLNHKFYQW